jgi:hypothetical protein
VGSTGEEFSCYSKLNSKGIPPPWILFNSPPTKSALNVLLFFIQTCYI